MEFIDAKAYCGFFLDVKLVIFGEFDDKMS
jgi:hypothetical protein